MKESETVARQKKVEAREAIFKLEDGSIIKGKINLLAEPDHKHGDSYNKFDESRGAFYSRVSDLFTSGKNPFIVVFDVTVEGREGQVIVLNKSKIMWVAPND